MRWCRAYQANPTLTAQREGLKATDATVAIARAAGRPQISATVGLNRDLTRSGLLDTGAKGPTVSGGVDLSVPLFNGGSVLRNSINAAKTRVEAGPSDLARGRRRRLCAAVSAYMDVIRDRAIVELNANNVKVLGTNLEATKDRFQIGDLTRTDVAQSEARLQLGRSQLSIAKARDGERATYRQVIGHQPGTLAAPPPLPPFPANADQAVQIALANNPDLIAISRHGCRRFTTFASPKRAAYRLCPVS